MAKFIDLKSDFGFKFCMQDEVIMLSFLNAILEGEVDRITHVKFENVEMPPPSLHQRGVTFDLLCTTEKGDNVLIEMQNSSQRYFKTRANFYIYNLMRRKIHKGHNWASMKRDITRILGIFIMGSRMEGLDKVITRTGECDLDTGKEFWDRVRKFFISLPMFRFDRSNITVKNIWISFFKNLGNMENIDPSVYERADEGLLRLIEKAKVSALSEEEYDQYEASMKYLEDEIDMEQHGYERGMEEGLKKGTEQGMKQGLEQGIKQGMEQGMKQGKLEGEKTANLRNAKRMKQKGLDVDDIAEITGLSLEDIEKL